MPITTIAFGSTGAQSIPTSGTATSFKITLGKKTGTTQNFVSKSEGWCDGTNVKSNSSYASATAAKQFESTSKIVSHWESTTTEVVAATFTSITAGNINVNISVTNANYDWIVEYEN